MQNVKCHPPLFKVFLGQNNEIERKEIEKLFIQKLSG